MIKDIVDLFYRLSEQHKLVKSFKYDRVSKGAGVGDEFHPMVFLEDPLFFGNASAQVNLFFIGVDFCDGAADAEFCAVIDAIAHSAGSGIGFDAL